MRGSRRNASDAGSQSPIDALELNFKHDGHGFAICDERSGRCSSSVCTRMAHAAGTVTAASRRRHLHFGVLNNAAPAERDACCALFKSSLKLHDTRAIVLGEVREGRDYRRFRTFALLSTAGASVTNGKSNSSSRPRRGTAGKAKSAPCPVVGAAAVCFHPAPRSRSGATIEILAFAVAPAHRQQGVARLLLLQIRRAVQRLEPAPHHIFVSAADTAKQFWEHVGFQNSRRFELTDSKSLSQPGTMCMKIDIFAQNVPTTASPTARHAPGAARHVEDDAHDSGEETGGTAAAGDAVLAAGATQQSAMARGCKRHRGADADIAATTGAVTSRRSRPRLPQPMSDHSIMEMIVQEHHRRTTPRHGRRAMHDTTLQNTSSNVEQKDRASQSVLLSKNANAPRCPAADADVTPLRDSGSGGGSVGNCGHSGSSRINAASLNNSTATAITTDVIDVHKTICAGDDSGIIHGNSINGNASISVSISDGIGDGNHSSNSDSNGNDQKIGGASSSGPSRSCTNNDKTTAVSSNTEGAAGISSPLESPHSLSVDAMLHAQTIAAWKARAGPAPPPLPPLPLPAVSHADDTAGIPKLTQASLTTSPAPPTSGSAQQSNHHIMGANVQNQSCEQELVPKKQSWLENKQMWEQNIRQNSQPQREQPLYTGANVSDPMQARMLDASPVQATHAKTLARCTPGKRGEKTRTSRYRGVCWMDSNKKWRAQIQHNSVYSHLGYFATEEEAARAFDAAARECRGPSAVLNFPAAAQTGGVAGISGVSHVVARHYTTAGRAKCRRTKYNHTNENQMEPHHQMEHAYGASLHKQDSDLKKQHADLQKEKMQLECVEKSLIQRQLQTKEAESSLASDAYRIVFKEEKLGFIVQHLDEVDGSSFRMHYCVKIMPGSEADKKQVLAGSEILRVNNTKLQGVSDVDCVNILQRTQRPMHVLFSLPQTRQTCPSAVPRPLSLSSSQNMPSPELVDLILCHEELNFKVSDAFGVDVLSILGKHMHIVTHIDEAGAAAKHGLIQGSEILRVNGTPTRRLTSKEFNNLLTTCSRPVRFLAARPQSVSQRAWIEKVKQQVHDTEKSVNDLVHCTIESQSLGFEVHDVFGTDELKFVPWIHMPMITEVAHDGAAYKMGVRNGHELLRVNGRCVCSLSHTELKHMLYNRDHTSPLKIVTSPSIAVDVDVSQLIGNDSDEKENLLTLWKELDVERAVDWFDAIFESKPLGLGLRGIGREHPLYDIARIEVAEDLTQSGESASEKVAALRQYVVGAVVLAINGVMVGDWNADAICEHIKHPSCEPPVKIRFARVKVTDCQPSDVKTPSDLRVRASTLRELRQAQYEHMERASLHMHKMETDIQLRDHSIRSHRVQTMLQSVLPTVACYQPFDAPPIIKVQRLDRLLHSCSAMQKSMCDRAGVNMLDKIGATDENLAPLYVGHRVITLAPIGGFPAGQLGHVVRIDQGYLTAAGAARGIPSDIGPRRRIVIQCTNGLAMQTDNEYCVGRLAQPAPTDPPVFTLKVAVVVPPLIAAAAFGMQHAAAAERDPMPDAVANGTCGAELVRVCLPLPHYAGADPEAEAALFVRNVNRRCRIPTHCRKLSNPKSQVQVPFLDASDTPLVKKIANAIAQGCRELEVQSQFTSALRVPASAIPEHLQQLSAVIRQLLEQSADMQRTMLHELLQCWNSSAPSSWESAANSLAAVVGPQRLLESVRFLDDGSNQASRLDESSVRRALYMS